MKIFIYIALFFFYSLASAQKWEYKILDDFNNFDTSSASRNIEKLSNNDIKNILKFELNYLQKGDLVDSLLFNHNLDKTTPYNQKCIYLFIYADFINRSSVKFSNKAYKMYLTSYKIAKDNKDTILVNESIRRILNHHQKNPKNIRDYQYYVNQYKKYSKGRINKFWSSYYDVSLRINKIYNYKEKIYLDDKSFDSLLYQANKPVFSGYVYQLKGIYYDIIVKNPEKGLHFSSLAKKYYDQSKEYYSKKSSLSVEMNIGVANFLKNDTTLALSIFKRLEKEGYYKKNLNSYISLLDWLSKVYEKKSNKDSSNYYYKQKIDYENILKERELAISIHEIDTKYQVAEKNKEISSLKKAAMSYQENKILYFILIGMVFLLAMYSFIRWKKVDMRRRKLAKEKESLQVEHTQTIEELEKVKQLVIEDHIVLKNKAKVYLNELIYIKAEDHYLQLFTSKKKEFVRGKISEIVNELPPNFVQTHRSYIVNKNLITSQNGTSVFLEGKIEIPLSRNFKKNITN